jgi:hypothetical protein
MKNLWKGIAIAGVWIGVAAIYFSPHGGSVGIAGPICAFLATIAIAD